MGLIVEPEIGSRGGNAASRAGTNKSRDKRAA